MRNMNRKPQMRSPPSSKLYAPKDKHPDEYMTVLRIFTRVLDGEMSPE